jgi:hypothetical protein
MKVKAYKTVDIECEVSVELGDCISEMISMAEEEGMRSRKITAIDGATRILDAIKPAMMAETLAKNPSAIEILRLRLKEWNDWIEAIQDKAGG